MKKEIIGYKDLQDDLEYICPVCGEPSLICEYIPKVFKHSYRKYECNICGCIWKIKMPW